MKKFVIGSNRVEFFWASSLDQVKEKEAHGNNLVQELIINVKFNKVIHHVFTSDTRLQWRRASQGFEVRDREAVKLGQDLAPMDRGNGEERARSCDNMEWIISFKKDQAKC